MKWAIYVLIFLWLLCGIIGAAMMGKLDRDHWKTVAKGPITLVTAINENPATVPGLAN